MTTQNMTWVEILHDSAVGGIDFENMEGYGGLKCKEYSSIERRVLESAVYLFVSLMCLLISAKLNPKEQTFKKNLSSECIDKNSRYEYNDENSIQDYNESFRMIVLFIYTLVNGIELGYKVIILFVLWKFMEI